MKKQFNRMKQLANQTVGRAEKTEVLSEDLLQIERRLDTVRSVCHIAQKRLIACFQGQHGTDPDKRHKKLPLTALAQNMQEGSVQLSDETLLGKMLDTCGDAENKLAMELSQHEVQIEREVLDPLCLLTETEIPNIQKQRKQLAKLVLDWDSARGRYNQAHKTSGTNFQVHPSKIESLKEEMDEAGNKVEQCKDQLAADMYNFVSKEGEYARCFVMLLEAQADYHRKALAVIEKVLPEIQAHQDKWTEKPAFGTPLEEHLKRSGREIAVPIEACVMMLLETGMREEGLFRIAAGASKLKKLKAALDCSTSQLDEFYSDPHAVAGALKSYLRELPEPLMTYSLYEEWTQAANIQDQDKKLQELWRICNRLPKHYHANFRYLIKFLAKLAQNSDVNKMTPSNVAIVLGPNLLWAKNEGSLAEMAAATSVHVVAVIEPIIQHADWFFPGDQDFNVSGAFVAIPAVNSNHLSHTGNEYESGTLERKRPVSMTVMEGDLLKKESTSKSKDNTSSATPPPVRNGGHAGTVQNQSTSSTNQLSVNQPQNAAGPSPHSMRRAVKKPAPAPPKPANPPPGQPASQSSAPAAQPPSVSPKPPARSSSPPAQHANQGAAQPSTSQVSAPRRYSSSLSPIQAPSHPPPQPPTQATPPPQPKSNSQASPPAAPSSEHGPEQPCYTPPQTPTPPDTPPLGKHNTSSPSPQPSAQETSQSHSLPQSGTLPRPRPVPKPRNRPSVPPPPHPPSQLAGDGVIANPTQTASKIVTDSSIPEPLQNPSSELLAETASKELHNHLMLDIDNDTESTAL
ncbi:rho GTPase-activating protein 17 isoform X5 [Falco biarmicus]|uniref:Rho GTPase-activating protein 17 n=1 Tax=Falco tinnunculus TaxID=100819 RepID=A0A8C4UUU0_FALTI|nr:rho GTPase-activating protein 17 isoform X5 [Falco rusticolus]XP_040444995.1 rho GTPase-activating protein 17 isoform X5 [Falco naumanni]XP_055563181.1 rho GTPase-activating protein 17 isoform X5 [Falco cherrug]XP_055659697.1 rho GTPase-activating protein 17 isoform X5 [Falco peregrinus]XP_056190625.1 rho GTPase-activating protein 17 isoform X5 [Falco biarmicus]